MVIRLLSLITVLAGLVAIDPPWIVLDIGDPIQWIASSRPDDALAGILRAAAILGTAGQAAAMTLLVIGRMLDSRIIQRIARRALLPVLRGAAPIALIAGTALPAAAETRLPITPPTARTVAEQAVDPVRLRVRVERGDSMWTIAADHTEGDVAPYWRALVELNRDRFADVNLIHPGDEILLPPEG
jgi:nucleoid-associated protein YgaU